MTTDGRTRYERSRHSQGSYRERRPHHNLDGDRIALKAKAKPSDELLAGVDKAEIVTVLRNRAEAAEKFLAAIQAVWPGARLLTDAEMAEDTQFRQQLILVREENAKAYATLTGSQMNSAGDRLLNTTPILAQ